VGPQPAQAPPRCTKCNSPHINGQCTNHRIAVRCCAVLMCPLKGYAKVAAGAASRQHLLTPIDFAYGLSQNRREQEPQLSQSNRAML